MVVSYKKKHIKKSSNKRKPSSIKRTKKNKSNTKITWEKFLQNSDSRKALKKSWSSKNPEKYYKNTIDKLAKKYSNKK